MLNTWPSSDTSISQSCYLDPSLRETESSPRAIFFGESLISSSRRMARVKKIYSRRRKNSRRRISSPRAKKYSRRRILHREQAGWLSAKKFFGESFFIALGGEILKKHFFTFNFFSIINMHLYKGYVKI
jgi:hypothetical protein